MGLEERARQALTTIEKQLDELDWIVQQARDRSDADIAFERLTRWREITVDLLSKHVHPNEAEKFADLRCALVAIDMPIVNLAERAEMYYSFLIVLREAIQKNPERVIEPPIPASVSYVETEARVPQTSNEVFIIHGHDEANLFKLKEMLAEEWGLDPIVMSEKPGMGRTLIEKFEDEAKRAVFAIALMSPDDVVKVDDGIYAQARPNVVFELGWFYGRLGRDRVCILFRENTHIHSDLRGISRIEFKESVYEKVVEIEKELEAAEIPISPPAASMGT